MTKRFYPSWIPEYDSEPLKVDFEIKNSEQIGKYLVSKKDFKKGDLVFRFSGISLPIRTIYTLEINEKNHIEDSFLMGFVSHSCDANCFVDMTSLQFIALENINKGDKITMNYWQTERKLFREFDCKCGSVNCFSAKTKK
tara:strand:+ start:60 stop:479 length:420 start_codon:yes stop_codon:yes gene_type:complete